MRLKQRAPSALFFDKDYGPKKTQVFKTVVQQGRRSAATEAYRQRYVGKETCDRERSWAVVLNILLRMGLSPITAHPQIDLERNRQSQPRARGFHLLLHELLRLLKLLVRYLEDQFVMDL